MAIPPYNISFLRRALKADRVPLNIPKLTHMLQTWSKQIAAIETAWGNRNNGNLSATDFEAIDEVLRALETGEIRAAEPKSPGDWLVHPWVLHCVTLVRSMGPRKVLRTGALSYFDQLDKFQDMGDSDWHQASWRVAPSSTVRRGVYLGEKVTLLPCYIGNGVHIGDDSLIDGFANIGSCAQIGKRVHISTGVCIGGILEPAQARPVIIEDDCFIGANVSLIEGVIVEQGSVIAMGVSLGQSTRILNRATGEVSYGRVPSGSVVAPGCMPSPDGTHSLNCAVIVKTVDEKTRERVSINELLRV